MNPITESLVKNYLQLNELSSGGVDKDFESFSAYSIINKIYGKDFDLDYVVVGGADDTGIDSLGIIVNGAIIDSIDEIKDLQDRNKYLDVTYVFIQSKTSERFETSQIGSFTRGVEDFFLTTYGLKCNKEIEQKKLLHKYIMENAYAFEANPKCVFYYVCTGKWKADMKDHKAIMEALKDKLDEASLFSDVSYKLCGAEEINKLYKATKNRMQATVNFVTKATMPEIPNVSSAYIGILPLCEFKKLILDDDGYIKSVFEDNIRDFQELTNPVNKTINDTLMGDKVTLFPLLNNGITIVASELQLTGNKMMLNDYQIVNGCQTSSVLAHHCGNAALQDISIPVKIIATNNDDTKNSITFATNNQTPVKREQLAALTTFQRNLEDYYLAIESSGLKLYYERRSNQYANDDKIPRAKIITVSNQIKAFSSMFWRNPHRVTSYFGELTKNIAKETSDIFNPQHLPYTYYIAGLAFYRLESLFKNNTIDSSNKKIRFFILCAFVVSIINDKFTKNDLTESRANKKLLDQIKTILDDVGKTTKRIKTIVKLINESDINITKDTLKTSNTTESIIALVRSHKFE